MTGHDQHVKLLRQDALVECLSKVAGEPLGPGQTPEELGAEALVASCRRLRLDLLEDRAGSIEVAEADQAAAERNARALAVLEGEAEPLLDLHASLDEAGRELARAPLGGRQKPDCRCDECRIADSLGLLERRASIRHCRVDFGLKHAEPCAVAQDPRQTRVVGARLDERLVQELDQRLRAASQRQRQLEEDVGTLDAVGDLGQELLEESGCHGGVASEAVTLCRPKPPLPLERRIVRRQLGGKLVELCCRYGRPTGCRLLGGGLQIRGDDTVRALGRERKMARSLLGVGDGFGERPVNGAALPERRLFVTDRAEQRVCEAQARVVEEEDVLPHRRIERFEDHLTVPVRLSDELDRRPGKRRDLEEDVAGLGRQPGQATAEHLVQALGHSSAPGSRRGSSPSG